jgi:tetratricopeptide (TPR) repeat protein
MKKNFMKSHSFLLIGPAIAMSLFGCATAPKQASDDSVVAAKASQAYLQDLVPVPATEKFADDPGCKVPDEAGNDKKSEKYANAGAPSKVWKKLVAHANSCVKSKNWQSLNSLGQALARIDMDSPWGSYFMSLASEGQGELRRAIWMADLAQKKSGGSKGIFVYQKARLMFLLKDYKAAMKLMEKSVEIEPSLTEAQVFLGDIHRRDLETDKAQACYLAALKVDPKNSHAIAALKEMNLLPLDSKPEMKINGAAKTAANVNAEPNKSEKKSELK